LTSITATFIVIGALAAPFPCRSALQPTGLFLLFYELLDSLRCLNAAWVSLSEGGR